MFIYDLIFYLAMRSGLASNYRRVIAFIIDFAIVSFIITKPLDDKLINLVPKDVFSLVNFFQNFNFKSFLIINLLTGIITILYWAILEYKIQQTLGGFILGIKIRSETKELSFLQSLVRNLTKISIILLILDSIQILYSDKKQRYSEKWSKTITIEDEK